MSETAVQPAEDTQSVRPFAAVLRERTRAVHEETETSDFMERLLGGEVGIEGYAALAAEHWVIYTALETTAIDLLDDPVAALFIDPALDRLAALETDLTFLIGPDFRDTIAPSDAARHYAARIQDVSTWSGAFVAHHYTRYLGDLSGGLALGRILARTYQLTPGSDGLRFYDFPAIPKPKPYKDAYRHALDTAGWSTTEQDRVVQESQVAFRLNAAATTVRYTLTNTGNVRTLGHETVTVSGPAGLGSVEATVIVDELMPGNALSREVVLDGIWPLVRLTAQVDVAPEAVAGEVAPVVGASGTAWSVPWVQSAILLVLVAVAVWLGLRRAARTSSTETTAVEASEPVTSPR